MYKVIRSVAVARGKMKEDKAYQEKHQKFFEKYGIPRKIWSVEGRRMGQLFIEFGPFESREKADAAFAKLFADKEWQDFHREWVESGTLIEGVDEVFLLTDY